MTQLKIKIHTYIARFGVKFGTRVPHLILWNIGPFRKNRRM